MTDFDHSTYLSPLTWRYGSEPMRNIWSEENKRKTMRQVWVALAKAQHQAGLVTAGQVSDLEQQVENIDIQRALTLEKTTRHDIMAEIMTYAEQCPIGGGIIHLGATSADITDNVDVIRIRSALTLLVQNLKSLLIIFREKILASADLTVMAYTHIQPAEPTTLGYRLASYAQDLLEDYQRIEQLKSSVKGKGLKGAVGTQAAFQELLSGSGMTPLEMEAIAMKELGLPYFLISTQTYTRQQDLHIQQALAGLGASLHKFALDFRILQSPAIGEWAEPFGKGQVGSSAMPFKRNPINAENICSLARYLAALPAVAWDNASQAILERSLDDSANRRLMQAEGFLIADELLQRTTRILNGIQVDQRAIEQNISRYGPFAASERVLMALVKRGVSRQEGHEWLRQLSLQAWEMIQSGSENPLPGLVEGDTRINHVLSQDAIRALMDPSAHTGTASIRARQLAGQIEDII